MDDIWLTFASLVQGRSIPDGFLGAWLIVLQNSVKSMFIPGMRTTKMKPILAVGPFGSSQ